jgi:hypothetical protein
MKTTPLSLAIAGVLAATATGAVAQTYGQAYSTYQQQQATYQAQQLAYNNARAKYESDRAAYDARYGYGAYERRYGAFVYTPAATAYGYGAYPAYPATTYPYTAPSAYGYGTVAPYGVAPYGTNPYYAGAYGANSAYTAADPCLNTSGRGSVNLGVLSALAQAALGGGVSTSSIINQAVLGAAVNNSVGARATSNVRCDSYGAYYTYSQTQPYREGYYDSAGRWHTTRTNTAYARCRIAPAPTNAYASEYRYVRVCPDASGRYRITA